MRRTALLAAAIGGLVATNSFAAFTFNTTRTALTGADAGFDRVNFLVSADTPTISVGAFAMDITALQANGLKFSFSGLGVPQANPASDDNTYTASGAGAGNRKTYGGLLGAINVTTPTANSANAPLYQQGLTTINYVGVYESGAQTYNTSAIGAFILGSAYVPTGVGVTFVGNIDDDLSNENGNTPYAVTDGVTTTPPTTHAPSLNPAAQTVNVVFGQTVSNGQTFTATVTASDADAADVLSIALGSLPAGITATATGGPGVSPQTFTISGTAAYSTNLTDQTINYTVNDGTGNSVPGTVTLHITPEPASLAALGGAALMGLIRRRK